MKKTLLVFAVLTTALLALQSFRSAPQDDGELSPFVGTWDWEYNPELTHCFSIWIGERNDSLLFTMGGVFYSGSRIHMPDYGDDNNFLQLMRIKKTEGTLVKGKMCAAMSNAYFNIKRAKTYNDFSFELLNDTTMLFIHSDTLSFWPDTAVMRRRDYVNNIFSNECHYYMRLEE